ncbi:MAG: isocitrate/isopropylmalate family dehydrogenase [Dehalococcoidia bacterium]
MTKRVCIIEGDDAAPEVIRPTVELLEVMELDLELLRPLTGEAAIQAHGDGFPDAAREAVDRADATLFGATSGKTNGAVRHLRSGKQTYANVRPIKWIPGAASPLANPEGIDYVIVRENLEDLYTGVEGDLAELEGTALAERVRARGVDLRRTGRYALKIITESGTRRAVRFACRLAKERKLDGHPGKVTAVAKFNLLRQTDGLFVETARDEVGRHGDLEYQEFIVDSFAHLQVTHPQGLDVVVMPNLYGDILSDAGAGSVGGLGIAPSGCHGDSYAYFEPVHGTAPDIAGKGIINPTAAILSAAMMLAYLGMADAARRLESAVASAYADGQALTPDQGGKATTGEFCAAVQRFL